ALVHPMDVREEEVTALGHVTDFILYVDGDLEIVLPVPAIMPIGGKHGVLMEDAAPLEIEAQAIEHDDVRCYQQEIRRQVGVQLIKLVEIAPRHEQAHDLGLARAGRELEDV